LTETGHITPDQIRAVTRLREETKDDELEALERAGILDSPAHEGAFGAYCQELVYRALTWREGDYRFTARARGGASPARRHVQSIDALLMEGMRRIDEAPRIQEIVLPETVFERAADPRSVAGLGRREHALIALVDGAKDARTLGHLAHLTEYEAGELLYNLHEAGLIRARRSADPLVLDLVDDGPSTTSELARLVRLVVILGLIALSLIVSWRGHAGDQNGEAALDSPLDHRMAESEAFARELFRAYAGREPAARGAAAAAQQFTAAGRRARQRSPPTHRLAARARARDLPEHVRHRRLQIREAPIGAQCRAEALPRRRSLSGPDEESAGEPVLREQEIVGPIPHHPGSGKIELEIGRGLLDEGRARLATGAAILGAMRAEIDAVEHCPFQGQQADERLVLERKIGEREISPADSRLIGDEDHRHLRLIQGSDGPSRPGQEHDLLGRAGIAAIFGDRAVAIEEHRRARRRSRDRSPRDLGLHGRPPDSSQARATAACTSPTVTRARHSTAIGQVRR
jgi:hypothetical protein